MSDEGAVSDIFVVRPVVDFKVVCYGLESEIKVWGR